MHISDRNRTILRRLAHVAGCTVQEELDACVEAWVTTRLNELPASAVETLGSEAPPRRIDLIHAALTATPGMTSKALAVQLSIKAPSTSALLSNLLKAGHVERAQGRYAWVGPPPERSPRPGRRQNVLDAVGDGARTAAQVSIITGITEHAANCYLSRLAVAGDLVRVRRGVYELAPSTPSPAAVANPALAAFLSIAIKPDRITHRGITDTDAPRVP